MKRPALLLAIPVLAPLASCRPAALAPDAPATADTRAVLGFPAPSRRRALDGLHRLLTGAPALRASGRAPSHPRPPAPPPAPPQKHPGLRVEIGALRVLQGAVHARVTVRTDGIWTDTWIFEMREHRIRAYSLASGRR